MGIDLKGKQIETLQAALLSAFPRRRDLETMVLIELDEDLDAIVEGGTTRDVALDLIKWAKKKSRIDDLLRGARTQNDTNHDLQRFAYEVALNSDMAPAGKLEALVVKGTPYADTASWRARMERAERCVGRVEYQSNGRWEGVGTGFLVGADLLMTNRHVLRDLSTQPRPWRICFDYAFDAQGLPQGGRPCEFVDEPPVHESPIEKLDFAVLRLAERVSDDAIDVAGSKRGVLRPKGVVLGEKQPLFILQHPNAERLKVGVGIVTQVGGVPPRVRYTANTLPGSSGSPCFDLSWELVAIHHAGESEVNRGIPFGPVLTELRGKIALGA